MTMSSEGSMRRLQADGTLKVFTTRGHGATAATSTLTKMLATNQLRAGDGMYSTPESRRSSRLFGETATRRTSTCKLEVQAAEDESYNPANDSCLDAFVRVICDRLHTPYPSPVPKAAAPTCATCA